MNFITPIPADPLPVKGQLIWDKQHHRFWPAGFMVSVTKLAVTLAYTTDDLVPCNYYDFEAWLSTSKLRDFEIEEEFRNNPN